MVPNNLDFAVAFLGCLYAGIIAVPLPSPEANNGKHTARRLSAVAGDAAPAVVISAGANAQAVSAWCAEVDALVGCEHLVLAPDDDSSPLTELRSAPPGETAYLQYTSGSTSTPRGVMVSQANVVAQSRLMQQVWQYTSDSVSVSWMPYFHDYGLLEGVLQPLYSGMQSYVMTPTMFTRSPATWLKAISTFRATHSAGAAFAFDYCVKRVTDRQLEGLDLSSLRVVSLGAERIHERTLRTFTERFASVGFRGDAFFPGYGLAEYTLMASSRPSGAPVMVLPPASVSTSTAAHRWPLVSCGAPAADTRILIVDPDTSRVCPPDTVGEVWLSGASKTLGYWNRPEETAEVFHAVPTAGDDIGDGADGTTLDGTDRYLRTGDLAFMHEGELFVTGRRKELIIVHGVNHYPEDIESTVQDASELFAGLRGAAFAADSDGEERLVVVHEISSGSLAPEQVAAVGTQVLQAIVENHGIDLHELVLVRRGAVPRTTSGKVQRSACSQLWAEGSLNPVATWPARRKETVEGIPADDGAELTRLREWLVVRLAEIAHIDVAEVDVTEPFARYGMTSLGASQMAADLEAFMGRPVAVQDFYEHPSIDALVRHLTGFSQPASPPVSTSGRPLTSAAPRPSAQPATSVSPRRGDASVGQHDDRVAIVGMGLRLPGGVDGPNSFWRLLKDGRDVVADVPPERWSVTDHYDSDPEAPGATISRWAALLTEVDLFDAEFFGISRREALRMDPQQRLLLEVTQEALDDAGLAREHIAGTNTGVFAGLGHPDYAHLNHELPELANPYTATGSFPAVAANRISYQYDLRGPSFTVDAVCSSALLAFHLACQSLARGECDQAIVGGASLILSQDMFVWFSKLGVMSPHGRSRSFDESADGIAFGEGVVSLVLRPLSTALAEGNQVYAVVRGSATVHEGRTNGLTAPGRDGQETLLRKAYQAAGISPDQVHYVEAHGTGTPVGDPIEVQALNTIVGQGRAPGNVCYIGSVKTNIGHLGMTAGLAGLAKVALMVRHRMLPPSLHYDRPNPRLRLGETSLAVVDRLMPWPSPDRALAAVTSISFGGSDVHVILEEADPAPARPVSLAAGEPHVLVISAHSEQALRQRAAQLSRQLQDDAAPALADAAYTAAVRRSHYPHRAAIVATSSAEAAEALAGLAAGTPANGVALGRRHPTRAADPVFVFCGEGGEWIKSAAALVRGGQASAEELEAVDRLMRPLLGYSVTEWLTGHGRSETENQWRPALFALHAAMAVRWRSLGIEPRAVVGHGVGEVAAAYTAGVLTREDAVSVVCAVDAAITARGTEAVGNGLEAALGGLRPRPASIPLYSSISGGLVGDRLLGAQHWAALLDGPGHFATALGESGKSGSTLRLEISPDARLGESAPAPGITVLASSRRGAETRTWAHSLGTLYCSGAQVRWERLFPSGNLTPLPSQPWQRQRYWLPDEHRPGAGEAVHEPAAEMMPSQWESRVDLAAPEAGPLRDHYALDTAVVPAAAYVALAHRAGRVLHGQAPYVLTGLVIDRAWPIPDEGAEPLTLTVDADGDFRFGSARTAPPAVRGRIEQCGPGPVRDRVPTPDVNTSQWLELLDATDHDHVMQLYGARYGAAYQTVTEVRRRDGAASGTVRSSLSGTDWVVASSVLDGCLQIAYQALPTSELAARMPYRIDRLRLHRQPAAGTYRVLAAVRGATPEVGPEAVVDLDVFGEDGELVAEIEGLSLKRVSGSPRGSALRRYSWRAALPPAHSDHTPESGDWLIVVDGSDHGERVAAGLRAAGRKVVTVREGDTVAETPEGWLAPLTRAGFAALAGELTVSTAEVAGIVWAADLSRRPPASHPAEAVGAVAGEVIALVGAWAEVGLPRLYLATHASGGTDGEALVTGHLAVAPLAALARTIRLEHPATRCTLLDLGSADIPVEDLARALVTPPQEPVVAFRSGRWQVPWLKPVPDETAESSTTATGLENATCVVTGGLGRLGLLVARRLMDRGVRRIVLAGRHAPDQEVTAFLSELDPTGDRLDIRRCDVGDPDQVNALLDDLDRSGPPVRGVVHAAAVLDDGVLTGLDGSRLRTTMRPKAAGAWYLHTATAQRDLLFFLMFSSVASVLGSSGQANYAVANGFLDALAEYRLATGLPAASINWGPWEHSSEDGIRGALHWASRGISALTTDEALSAFDLILDRAMGSTTGTDTGHTVVFRPRDPIPSTRTPDASAVPPVTEAAAHPPSTSTASGLDGVSHVDEAAYEPLADCPKDGDWSLADLEEWLLTTTEDVLGDEGDRVDIEIPFQEMGFDSLMSLELQARIEGHLPVRVSSTALWRYPDIASLAVHLMEKLVSRDDSASQEDAQ